MTASALEGKLAHYDSQAGWTRSLRAYLYRLAEIGTRERALDVGCGGGWLTAELHAKVKHGATGCDIDEDILTVARRAHSGPEFVVSRPARLPFADDTFDLCCCHFTLLWATEPVALLAEMKRVSRPGAIVLVMAEPDWGGYLEWPDLGLGPRIAAALATQGADPLAGRQLRAWLVEAGLTIRELGITAGPWPADENAIDAAWRHHRWTLADLVEERTLRVLERQARRAWAEGVRTVHLPLAWAAVEV
ncbi:MAG: methyltransferase domain-containing protein [Candidatus Lernaella stagnicola]|nr:methyltransferase domain-containing protein [Candidatus Lernaella stagnicola]